MVRSAVGSFGPPWAHRIEPSCASPWKRSKAWKDSGMSNGSKDPKKIHAQHIRIFCLGTLKLFYVFLPSRYIHLEVRNISRKLQMISVHSIQWEKKIQTAKFDLPHVLASICPRCLCVFAGYYTCQAFVVFAWARRVATCH